MTDNTEVTRETRYLRLDYPKNYTFRHGGPTPKSPQVIPVGQMQNLDLKRLQGRGVAISPCEENGDLIPQEGDKFGDDPDNMKTIVEIAEELSPLVEAEAVEPAQVVSKRPQRRQELMGEIVNAIDQLPTSTDELWTADGRPQVKALESVLDYDISAGERDKAFENYRKRYGDK